MIAIMEDKQAGIYEDLVQFGCKNIVAVEYSYALELERWQLIRQRRMSDHESLRSEIVRLTEKLEQIQDQIQEQNEISATNTEAFKRFENCNYGKNNIDRRQAHGKAACGALCGFSAQACGAAELR